MAKATAMLSQILKHTPLWVFVLFLVLLVYGLSQLKPRQVSRSRLFILPAVMLGLSLLGVFTGFGFKPTAFFMWVIGVGAALGIGQWHMPPRRRDIISTTVNYYIPGSWGPLALMMTIFAIKYAVGVIHARHLAIAQVDTFVWIVCLSYGLLSGVFLVRALKVYRIGRA